MPNDNDNDGLPDYKDVDSDNDSISDGYECFDIENNYTMLPCLDTDGDGVPDILIWIRMMMGFRSGRMSRWR